MKNNLKYFLIIIFLSLNAPQNTSANEPFIFDVTEIEILENGNQINGYQGGTAVSEDGSKIIGENFYYNKLTNILEVEGNVRYIDDAKNTTITSDKAIYLKNEEKIFTKGNSKAENENNTISASNLEYDKIQNIYKAKENAVVKDYKKDATLYADQITYLKNEERIFTKGKTKAFIEKKYTFKSEDVSYLRNSNKIFSQKKSSVEDDNSNIYTLDNFSYDIKDEILKGENVDVLAKVEKNKIDRYFFSEGFFNF